eukprot:10035_6
MMREKKPGEVAQIPSAAVLLGPYLPPFAVDLLAKLGSFAPPSFDIIAGFLLVFSLATRFYRLGFPNEVIFDEVHFGGFTNRILDRFTLIFTRHLQNSCLASLGTLDTMVTFHSNISQIGMMGISTSTFDVS